MHSTQTNFQPKVSIITPSYNQGIFVEETIKSVLNQDYPNIEYIIIDGGSEDDTIERIKKYEAHLAFWISEKDNGQTAAILKGFKKCTGKYITWLCSDDILEPSAVKLQVAFLEKHKDVGLVYGDRIRIDDKGNIIGCRKYPQFKKWYLKMGFALPQETVLIRKEVYDQTQGLDSNLQMAMDFDLWCKLSHITNFLHIPAFLGRFRSHDRNKSTQFSHSLRKTKLKVGDPKELNDVYRKHFGRELNYWLYKNYSKFAAYLALWYRHGKKYSQKILTVNEAKNTSLTS